MTITNWPINERPREKLYLQGPKSLSDAELLAIFLRTGVRGKTALDIARELLRDYGSLRGLFNADADELTKVHGLGKAKVAVLKASLELGSRYLEEDLKKDSVLSSSQRTKHYLINRLGNSPHEIFGSLFLDSQNNLLCFEELFRGTLNEATIYPREVVKRALKHNSAKMILVHNHPSGNLMPSKADAVLTDILKQALALVAVQVVDHVIVGQNQCVSFADLGLI